MKRYAILPLMAAALAGCAKVAPETVEIVPSEENTPFVIYVGLPEATKTSFNEETYAVTWDKDDALAVTIDGKLYKFEKEKDKDNAFRCNDFKPVVGETYEYDILYPYSEDGKFTMSGGVTTPMHGIGTAVGTDSPNVHLKQLTALIKVTIKNENAVGTSTLTALRIETDDEVIGGSYTITDSGVEPVDGENYTERTDLNESIAAGASKVVFVQCAPFTAAAGSKLLVKYSVDGVEYVEEKTFRKDKDVEFKAGTVNKTSVSFAAEQCIIEGTAVTGGPQLMTKCLEKDKLYAFRAELSEGNFRIRLTGENGGVYAPVSGNDINDGQTVALTENENGHWTVPAAGVYRVVVDFDAKNVAIYSSATDMKNVSVSYNNTVNNINPYTQEVTELWMWGGGLGWDHDAGMKNGFQSKYKLIQSLADPTVFVYSGGAIPRKTNVDVNNVTGANVGKAITGHIQLLVSNIENNVWAYGSTAAAKRKSYSGYVTCELGKTYEAVGGQGDNRYAYHIVPEGANFLVVKIDPNDNTKATVRFEKK